MNLSTGLLGVLVSDGGLWGEFMSKISVINLEHVELEDIRSKIYIDTTKTYEEESDITAYYLGDVMSLSIISEHILRLLFKVIKPSVIIQLRPGAVEKIDEKLIVEKTRDRRIIIYEVIE